MVGASAFAACHTNSSRTYCFSPSESRGPGHPGSSIYPSESAEPRGLGNLVTAEAALRYDTFCVPGKAPGVAGREGFGVRGLAVPDGSRGVLRRRPDLALCRIPSGTHPGAVGGPTSRTRRREDATPGPMAVELTVEVRGYRALDPLPNHGVGIRLLSSEG